MHQSTRILSFEVCGCCLLAIADTVTCSVHAGGGSSRVTGHLEMVDLQLHGRRRTL